MLKIWAKVVKDNKIIKSYVFQTNEHFEIKNFFNYMTVICENLNLGTPVIIPKHISNFIAFNSVKFFSENFLETCNFDYLQLQNISE